MPSTWFSSLDERSKKVAQAQIADMKQILTDMQAELVPRFRVNTMPISATKISGDKVVAQMDELNKAATTQTSSKGDKADIKTILLDEAIPLNGMNVQLKQVGDGCITVDRGQHWNLFRCSA